MDTLLATEGLRPITFSGIETESIGGSGTTVSSACANLDTYADNLELYIEELNAQFDYILEGWEGEAANTLRDNVPLLLEAFKKVPPAVQSISGWAATTMRGLEAHDSEEATRLNQVMGGLM